MKTSMLASFVVDGDRLWSVDPYSELFHTELHQDVDIVSYRNNDGEHRTTTHYICPLKHISSTHFFWNNFDVFACKKCLTAW